MTLLRSAINQPETKSGRCFGFVIQALILFSLVTYSVDTLPDIEPQVREWLRVSEIVVCVIFTVEYLLRLYYAESRWGYALSFYGIIDLLAIVPFYVASGLDLRPLRVFRMFRLLRLFKVMRYNAAAARLLQALRATREELVIFSVATLMLLFVASVGIYYFECQAQPEAFQSVFHSLWWAVATLTTVGYGDVYPITVGGRVFTFVILMLGLGIVAIPAGLIAAALSQIKQQDAE
ncbi:MAG: ion transporter [Pseudomonadota bacterium]